MGVKTSYAAMQWRGRHKCNVMMLYYRALIINIPRPAGVTLRRKGTNSGDQDVVRPLRSKNNCSCSQCCTYRLCDNYRTGTVFFEYLSAFIWITRLFELQQLTLEGHIIKIALIQLTSYGALLKLLLKKQQHQRGHTANLSNCEKWR